MFPPAAGNESCPQPQTSEHLAAIEIMKLKHIIILQNKIDLINESQATEQHQQILKFVQGRWPVSRCMPAGTGWLTRRLYTPCLQVRWRKELP